MVKTGGPRSKSRRSSSSSYQPGPATPLYLRECNNTWHWWRCVGAAEAATYQLEATQRNEPTETELMYWAAQGETIIMLGSDDPPKPFEVARNAMMDQYRQDWPYNEIQGGKP